MSDNKLKISVFDAAAFGIGVISGISYFVAAAGINFFAEKALEKIIHYELDSIEKSEHISDAATPSPVEEEPSPQTLQPRPKKSENVEAE